VTFAARNLPFFQKKTHMPCNDDIMSTLKTPKNNGSFRLKSINTVCSFLVGDLGWQKKTHRDVVKEQTYKKSFGFSIYKC